MDARAKSEENEQNRSCISYIEKPSLSLRDLHHDWKNKFSRWLLVSLSQCERLSRTECYFRASDDALMGYGLVHL